PTLELIFVPDALRFDEDPSLHRFAGDVEGLDVRLPQCVGASLRFEPHNERVLPDADEQVAVEKEADSAEHFLLFNSPLACQGSADAVGQRFVKSHLQSFVSDGWDNPALYRLRPCGARSCSLSRIAGSESRANVVSAARAAMRVSWQSCPQTKIAKPTVISGASQTGGVCGAINLPNS